MAQPPAYARAFSFTDYTANYPSLPHPGVRLDAEFNALATTIAAIRTNLALIQRDDGQLANISVGADQLSPEITIGLRSVASWATDTDYVVNDAVWVGAGLYRCLEVHTSAAAFATDLAAARWTLVHDLTTSLAAAINAAIASGDIDVEVDVTNFAALNAANAFSGINTFSAAPVFSTGAATSAGDYWAAKPTDYGAGKPGVFLRKRATADEWELVLDDGAGGEGVLDLVGDLKFNGESPVSTATITSLQTAIRRARHLALSN